MELPADLIEEVYVCLRPVVGVCPRPSVKRAPFIEEGHFRVYSPPQVQAVHVILGGQEHNLGKREIPWVNIDRAPCVACEFFFDAVRDELCPRDAILLYGPPEDDKLTLEPFTEFRPVIIGVGEVH